ncbi:MAG: PIN domain-containing protein [Actinobacteria bacterium]|nr:PIN domain-containing protein [Actinomycetota bacterium]
METSLSGLIDNLNSKNTILIDTPFLIYHFKDIKPYSDITEVIFNNTGARNSRVFLSIISFTEILVGLLKKGNADLIKTFKDFMQNNPFISTMDFTYELSETAASIRSETGLGLADSIICATAVKSKSSYLITNDVDFLKFKNKDIKILILDNLVAL